MLEETTCEIKLQLNDSRCTEILRQRGNQNLLNKYKKKISILCVILNNTVAYFFRDKNGKIIKAAPFQSKLTPGSMARVEPNRRWFGKIKYMNLN